MPHSVCDFSQLYLSLRTLWIQMSSANYPFLNTPRAEWEEPPPPQHKSSHVYKQESSWIDVTFVCFTCQPPTRPVSQDLLTHEEAFLWCLLCCMPVFDLHMARLSLCIFPQLENSCVLEIMRVWECLWESLIILESRISVMREWQLCGQSHSMGKVLCVGWGDLHRSF